MEELNEVIETLQKIAKIITNDKDYKDVYYAEACVTLYNAEEDNEEVNGYDHKELIHGDPNNPFQISIYKIVDEGYLRDGLPDDFDYGFHDPYEPTKDVCYIVKNLDYKLIMALENLAKEINYKSKKEEK